jgi:membrane protease YdiL (CAAX protease family)
MSELKSVMKMNLINPEVTGQSTNNSSIFPIGPINLFLFGNLIMVVICGIAFGKQVIIGSIILESTMLLTTLGWIGLQGKGYRETLRLKCPSIQEIGLTLIIVAVGINVASFIDQLWHFYLQNLGTITETNIPRPQNISEFMLSMTAIVILPALAEEVLFRGFILKNYEKYLSTGKAVFISSLLFGLAHLSIGNFWGPFILGLLCGWLVCIYDSIFLGIIGHLLNNGLTMTLLYLMPNLWAAKQVTVKDLIIGFPWFVVAGLILLMLILRYKPNLKTNGIKQGKLFSVLKHWSIWILFMMFGIFAAMEFMMMQRTP